MEHDRDRASRTVRRAARLELNLVRIRWFGVAFGLFQVWTGASVPPIPPPSVQRTAYLLVAVLGVGNVLMWLATRRASSAASYRRIGLAAFALDIIVVVGNSWAYSFDRNGITWVLMYVLPLEGAMRYQLRGAVAVVGIAVAAELGREVYRLHLFPDLGFFVSAVTFRVGVLAIIALVAGLMARTLARQAREADARARAFEDLARRETEARREVQAERAQTVRRLEELARLKSDFVAITSHELRTPLTGIRGFASVLLKKLDTLPQSEIREYLQIVDEQSQRLSRLVEDLLVVSRLDEGRLKLSPREVEVHPFVDGVVASFAAEAVRITVESPSGEARARFDPDRVEQMLRNLIHNALKFSPESAPVTVRFRQAVDGQTEFEVSDRGVGVPPEEAASIFERFHQAENGERREREGVGLGLYITKRLLDEMGGQIEVDSSAGGGTTFRFRIPPPPPTRIGEPAPASLG